MRHHNSHNFLNYFINLCIIYIICCFALKESTTPGDLISGRVNIKWEEGAPLPVSCSGHTAVWLNGVVYVGGGTTFKQEEKLSLVSLKPLYIINCYDPVSHLWSPPIDTPQCYFAMTTLNNKLLIAGGQTGRIRTNQVLIMDAGQLKNYTKLITARSLAVAAGHQGMLIIAGGYDNNKKILSSTEIFDSNNGQWYTCSDLPQPHYWLQSVIVENILYLLGGVNNIDGNSVAVFTAPLNTLSRHQLNWNTYQDLSWCRSFPVSINGKHLLIVGGIKKDDLVRSSDIYKLNKVTHSWEVIGHIPLARSLSAAVITADNRLIVIGGRNDKDKYTNTVWIGSCEPQY